MPTFPHTLAEPVSRSLQIVPRSNRNEFAPDLGPPITRRRSTARLVDYSAELFLTEAQRQLLDNFFRNDCGDGSLQFDMTDYLGGTISQFKWTSEPEYRQAGPGGYWYVSIAMVKMP